MCVLRSFTCGKCGKVNEYKHERGRLRKYCVPECELAKPVASGICICGKPTKRFSTNGRFARHCSPRCGTKAAMSVRPMRAHAPKIHANKCEACGREWEGRKRRFCGPECRAGKYRRTCERCGKEFATGKNSQFTCSIACAQQARRARRRHLRDRKCVGCGNVFNRKKGSRDAGDYCSRKCAFEKAHHFASRDARLRAVSDGCFAWLVRWRTCVACECRFWNPNPDAQVCSGQCRQQHLAKLRFIAARQEPWVCGRCGCDIPHSDGRKQVRCKPCLAFIKKESRKAHKARRRAKMLTNGPWETIHPTAVFERDNWTCRLCGQQLDRSVLVPDPKAATMDHIIPLSKGGTHTMANVQCACFECNWMKGDGDKTRTYKADAMTASLGKVRGLGKKSTV